MARLFFLLGSLLAGISVVMGSWGAHADIFDEVQTLWIDKAVRYQMFHSLALLCTSLLIASQKKPAKPALLAGFCFLGGIVLFCGSLYFMAVSSVDAGLVTPAGGILFLIGWLCLALCGPGRK
jgi:uncharacterized membrane protein YgdD (TMEM256/DUF423 family)